MLKFRFFQVRAGGGEDLEAVGAELQEKCDCVVVHKIGFVLTLYRDSSLPPPACLQAGSENDSDGEEELDKKGKKKKKPSNGPQLPPPPPEFTIL